MKRYFFTWTEKRGGTQTTYQTFKFVEDRRAAKDMVLIEQNYRRLNSLPHMFNVMIGQHSPNVSWRAKQLYIWRKDSNQEAILEIKNELYRRGVIR